ncbi:hypothetical protein [Lysinibacillus agricola]|uniref:hypothetical protein n=1 Tax=Lysinibacillus agricola TaxID=2590012 RepID=UPI003C228EBC
MHNIEVIVDHSTWVTSPVPPELRSINTHINFNLLDLLFHVSDATKNPNDIGVSINDYWAFLRYRNCFNSSGDLQLNESFEDVDSHQKTILSDDIGMGFASLIMDRTFNIQSLIDTSFFIRHLPSLQVVNSRKKGPNKTPDFLVLDNSYEIHIIECKGTQNTLSSSETQLLKGVPQKTNILDPSNIINQKLVIGTYIAKHNSRDTSRIKIIDPELNYNFSNIDKDDIICLSLLGQFTKELNYYISSEISKLIPNISLDDVEAFRDLKELILQDGSLNTLTTEIQKNNYREFTLEKSFDFSLVKEVITASNTMREFVSEFKEYKRSINDGVYKGIFGLTMKLSYTE